MTAGAVYIYIYIYYTYNVSALLGRRAVVPRAVSAPKPAQGPPSKRSHKLKASVLQIIPRHVHAETEGGGREGERERERAREREGGREGGRGREEGGGADLASWNVSPPVGWGTGKWVGLVCAFVGLSPPPVFGP